MSIGDELGPLRYRATTELHRSFLDACATSEPVRDALAADGPSLHPTFSVTDYSRLVSQRYGAMGTGLHTAHESEFVKPVPVGSEVSVAGTVSELFERNGRDYWVVSYEVASPRGDLYARHRMTATVDRDDQTQPEATGARPRTEPTAASTLECLIERGFSLESQTEFGRQYSLRFDEPYDPSGNAHSDREFARRLGLPDAIGHSSQYYAWMAEAAIILFGKQWLTGGWLRARFRAPVFPGDTLRVGTTAIDRRDGSDSAVELLALTLSGTTVAVATAGPLTSAAAG